MDNQQTKVDLSGIEETGLLTLYTRAIESQSKDPILQDEKIEVLVDQLDPLLKNQDSKMAERLR